MRDVKVGTTTFASLDLLSSDTPADMFAAVTDTVQHMPGIAIERWGASNAG